MESLLTLVIAVGGIATGIGAIWAALVARRQAQISQQSFREQNERARLSLETDLMYKLEERLDSQRYRIYRKESLMYVKENYFVDDDILEVQQLDSATPPLLDFFEELGYLVNVGVLSLERVMLSHWDLMLGWVLWEPAIKKLREELGQPQMYEEFEKLYHQMVDFERQSTGRSEPPTKEELRQFVEVNLRYVANVEKPTTGDEEAKKG